VVPTYVDRDRALEKPDTLTGTLELKVLPLPSWPNAPEPQHFTAPPAVRAHV